MMPYLIFGNDGYKRLPPKEIQHRQSWRRPIWRRQAARQATPCASCFYCHHHLYSPSYPPNTTNNLPEAEFLLCNSRPQRDDDGANQNSIELGQPVCYLDIVCRLGVSLDMFVDWDIRLQISTEPTHLEGKSLWYGVLMAFSPQCWYPGVNSSLCEE